VRSLRVGVIGLGVGEQHVAGFRAHPSCDVVAVCDLDRARLERAGDDDPSLVLLDDAEALITSADVDVVSIASYDDAHFAQALLALRNGKHVFCEKPLCRTAEEVQLLEDAWRDAGGSVLASNLVLRAAPFYRWLRSERASGGLGRVYAFDGDYLYGRLDKITEGWRKGVDDYSVMLGGGVHLVDLMLWTTGERPNRVSATGNRIATEGTGFRYLDFVAATYEFPSGLIGRITANFASVGRHQHVVRIFATEASVVHDDGGPRIQRVRDPGEEPERLDLAALPASKAELITEFVQRILDGGDTAVATRHEFDVIRACAAADLALAEGGSVDIEHD
jgi:predicted dehydrogenase